MRHGRARTVHHVDDDAELASEGTVVDEGHTAGLDQSPVRLRNASRQSTARPHTNPASQHPSSHPVRSQFRSSHTVRADQSGVSTTTSPRTQHFPRALLARRWGFRLPSSLARGLPRASALPVRRGEVGRQKCHLHQLARALTNPSEGTSAYVQQHMHWQDCDASEPCLFSPLPCARAAPMLDSAHMLLSAAARKTALGS